MVRVSYQNGDEIIEVIVRDSSGAKIETWRCNRDDEKEYGKIISRIWRKYGAKPIFDNSFLDIDKGILDI